MRGWEKSRRPLHSKHTSPLDKVAFVTAQHCLHLCIRYSKRRQQQSLITGLSDLNFSLPSWVKLRSLTEKGNGPSLTQERWWEGGRMLSTTHNSSRFVLSNKRVFSWLTDFSPSLSPWICPAILGFWLTLVTLIGSDPDPDPDLQAYFPVLPWPSPTQEPDALGSRLSLAAHRSPLFPAYPVPSLQVVGPGPGLWGHSPCQPKDPPYLPALTAHQQHGPSLLRKQPALIFLKQVKISEWVLISYPQVIELNDHFFQLVCLQFQQLNMQTSLSYESKSSHFNLNRNISALLAYRMLTKINIFFAFLFLINEKKPYLIDPAKNVSSLSI